MNENEENVNIFVVGPEARGQAFIGREKEIEELENVIFKGVGSISLVGPTRIGKSSLVREVLRRNVDSPKYLQIYLNAGICKDAFHFWKGFWVRLEKQIKTKKMWNDIFEDEFDELKKITFDTPDWYSEITSPIQYILEEIDSLDHRLVLAIDEFDSITRCFGENIYYYQFLRSIFSEADWATNGILISRRSLPLLVANCSDLSAFENVFMNMPLHAFSEDDMEIYYSVLNKHGIQLNENAKSQLRYYTGSLPYLCSMFGLNILLEGVSQIGENEIRAIHKKCLPQIEDFYKMLEDRLREDNHFDFIWSLSMRLPQVDTQENKWHQGNMEAMGVLSQENVNEVQDYYAYTRDFMDWISFRSSSKSTWECIDAAETKIKTILANELPLFNIKFKDIKDDKDRQDEIDNQLKDLRLKGKATISSMAEHYYNKQEIYNPNAILVNLLTLSQAIGCVLDAWDTHFYKYFDVDGSEWKNKLDVIQRIRIPIDHNSISYISEKDQNVCKKYCDELIQITI